MRLPPAFTACTPQHLPLLQDLTDIVFKDLATQHSNPEYMASRAILTPLNVNTQQINVSMLQQFPAPILERSYFSMDTVPDNESSRENQCYLFPTEWLNQQEPGGQ
jgi:hypothetical protein